MDDSEDMWLHVRSSTNIDISLILYFSHPATLDYIDYTDALNQVSKNLAKLHGETTSYTNRPSQDHTTTKFSLVLTTCIIRTTGTIIMTLQNARHRSPIRDYILYYCMPPNNK